MSTRRYFNPPKSVKAYGFENGQPVPQAGSASGFLLGWDALDAHVQALAERRPCEFVVTAEDTRDPDGLVFPVLGMNPDYMEWTGHIVETTRTGRIIGWHLPKPSKADAA